MIFSETRRRVISMTYGDKLLGLMAPKAGKALGKVLRDFRRGLDLTLDDMKDKTGISPGTLSNIERGKQEPTRRTLDKLVKPYKVTGVGVFYAKAQEASRTAAPARTALGVSHVAVGAFMLDAQTFDELSDLAAKLHRLVGRIEGRPTRHEAVLAPTAAPVERGAPRARGQ